MEKLVEGIITRLRSFDGDNLIDIKISDRSTVSLDFESCKGFYPKVGDRVSVFDDVESNEYIILRIL